MISNLQSKIERRDFDVFLCHNSEDKPAVKKIGECLKERDILPWLDEWELQPGLAWQPLLEKQIGQIKSAAVFVGKNGIGPWQNMELEAFLREFVKRVCPVIPVILLDCGKTPELPLFLKSITWIDFRKDDPNPMEQLIWGITGEKDFSSKSAKDPAFRNTVRRDVTNYLDFVGSTDQDKKDFSPKSAKAPPFRSTVTRVGISYPDFVGSTDQDKIERAFAHIAGSLTKHDAEFLFGAGMSRDNDAPSEKQMPLGTDVAIGLLGHFFPPEGGNPPNEQRLRELAGEYPFEAIAEAVEKILGTRRRLTSALKDILCDEIFEISQAHRDFHAISNWGGKVRLNHFFTTNIDPLFSKMFGGGAAHITEENVRDIRTVQEAGKIAIIDLHGSLDSDYIITETDVFDKEYKSLRGEFHSASHTAEAFVFVGYSMNDPDFRRIYMEYRQKIAERGEVNKRTYFVAPAEDQFSYRLGSVIWEGRGVVWIPFDATKFFAVLRRFLEQRDGKRVREEILKKYGYAPEDNEAFEDLVQRTADILRVERSDAVAFLYATRTRTGGAE